jgi:hypothetical protein
MDAAALPIIEMHAVWARNVDHANLRGGAEPLKCGVDFGSKVKACQCCRLRGTPLNFRPKASLKRTCELKNWVQFAAVTGNSWGYKGGCRPEKSSAPEALERDQGRFSGFRTGSKHYRAGWKRGPISPSPLGI